MSNELFIDLTVEQQEVVAGGLDIDINSFLNGTSFEDITEASKQSFDFGVISNSGPNGTTNGLTTSFSAESLFKSIFTDGITAIGA